MSKHTKYKLNPVTLLFEVSKISPVRRLARALLVVVGSIGLFLLVFWFYTSVLGLEPPKTTYLKKKNAEWTSKIELMNRTLDLYDEALTGLDMRNEGVYRSVFGLGEIPQDALGVGFDVASRKDLDKLSATSPLRKTYERLDEITRTTYIESKSLDEVENLSKRAGDMASCLPAICPIVPRKGTYRISSRYGYRTDPIRGYRTFHSGYDFAMKAGNPIYATGDGVIESVDFRFYGYGNQVVINHGFGYKTRYAHMRAIYVAEGMKIKRGECIGEVGNTGKSTGAHLHYEVLYKNRPVNPLNYFDIDMPLDEYLAMVKKSESEAEAVLSSNFQVKKRQR